MRLTVPERGESGFPHVVGEARRARVRGLPSGWGIAELRGFQSLEIREPRGDLEAREKRRLAELRSWEEGAGSSLRGMSERRCPPEHWEGVNDTGKCSLRGRGSTRNLRRPCKFQVVESGHPVALLPPSRLRASGCAATRENRGAPEQRPGDGGDNTGVEGTAPKDAGASQRIRVPAAFSEGGENSGREPNSWSRRGCQGEMLGVGGLEAVGSAGRRTSFL